MPHPTRVFIISPERRRNCPTLEPIAAPICAIGASLPTEPPEPSVAAAVKVRRSVVLGFISPPLRVIDSIASGTPSPFASCGYSFMRGAIRRPPMAGRMNRRYRLSPRIFPWISPKKIRVKKPISLMNTTAPRPARAPMTIERKMLNAWSEIPRRESVRNITFLIGSPIFLDVKPVTCLKRPCIYLSGRTKNTSKLGCSTIVYHMSLKILKHRKRGQCRWFRDRRGPAPAVCLPTSSRLARHAPVFPDGTC